VQSLGALIDAEEKRLAAEEKRLSMTASVVSIDAARRRREEGK
jgi:hypothetical protein